MKKVMLSMLVIAGLATATFAGEANVTKKADHKKAVKTKKETNSTKTK